jgi:hypothetical protein
MQLATIYISRMRLGVPVNYKAMLIFYVDKRERMIVFMEQEQRTTFVSVASRMTRRRVLKSSLWMSTAYLRFCCKRF